MRIAKLIEIEESQAVILPDDCRFVGQEVFVVRVNGGVLLTERDPWELFEEGISELSDECMLHRRQPPIQPRDF